MDTQFKIPDPETRARTLAKLREARHQADLAILMLDETLALLDRDLLQQRRARLLHKSNTIPAEKIES